MRTGDVVVQDDEGYLVVVDRLKDMIIRGGENVYCVEVEQAIQSFGEFSRLPCWGFHMSS